MFTRCLDLIGQIMQYKLSIAFADAYWKHFYHEFKLNGYDWFLTGLARTEKTSTALRC